jgi:protein O-mannosyl-transferase
MPARATWWIPILALVLAFAAHVPARHAAFQFDDFPAVVENPALSAPFRFGDLFRPSAAGADYVRPVLFLTYRACDALAGVSDSAADLGRRAVAQHTGNLVLHLANVLLVYALGRVLAHRAGQAHSPAPAIAALLYAVHPALSEGVNYVAGRSSTLVATWAVIATSLAIATPSTRLRQLGALLATALALGSKEVALVIPALVLVTGRATSPDRRWPWRAAAGPALLALLAIFLWRGHAVTAFQPPLIASWLMGVRAAARYTGLLLIPRHLSVDYGWVPPPAHAYWPGPRYDPAALEHFALAALFLMSLAAIAMGVGRRRPLVAAGSLWFAIALLPSVAFPIRDPIFEHRLTLAAPGLLLAIADLGVLLGERTRHVRGAHRALFAALAGLLLLFVVQTRHRAADWSSERRLWADCWAKQPQNPRAAFNLGAAITAEVAAEQPQKWKQMHEAEALYRCALALHPALAYGYELRAYATTNLGYLYLTQARAMADSGWVLPGMISEMEMARLGARGMARQAVSVLDSATTYRVRSGSALVPYPEAYENLAAALFLVSQLELMTGDPTASAAACTRAERAIAVALELAPTPERARLAQAIAQFRGRTFVDDKGRPR